MSPVHQDHSADAAVAAMSSVTGAIPVTAAGTPVGFRVDSDRADPELAERAEDPDCDLAAVGNEHF